MNLRTKLILKIRKEFPQVKFKTAELVTKGWDYDVLVLDDKFIFRFAKEKMDRKSFVREIKFLQDFGKVSNLNTPKYSLFSKDKTFGGYNIIKGKELTAELYKKLSKSKKQLFVKQLAKFLTSLHNFSLKKAQSLGFKKYPTWAKEQEERRKWFKREYFPKMSKYLTPKQQVFIKKFVADFTSSKYKITPVLGHLDLSHDHIIMRPNSTISGIIDFGDLKLCDPAQELSGFFDYDRNLAEQIYKLYQGPKDPLFLKRSKDHFIHHWIYLLYDAKIRRKNEAFWKEAVPIMNKIIDENSK